MSQNEECFPPQLVWQVYRIPIVLGVLSLLFIGLSITIYIKTYQNSAPIHFRSDDASASSSSLLSESNTELLFIDIEGAVKKPGVYQVVHESRVEDVLVVAGGLSSDVDHAALGRLINRAAKVSDGAKIYIPSLDDIPILNEGGSSADQSGVIIQINTASQSELEALSGVGPVTAEKIMGNRPYMRLEELVEKKVMSQSLFDKLKDQLSL